MLVTSQNMTGYQALLQRYSRSSNGSPSIKIITILKSCCYTELGECPAWPAPFTFGNQRGVFRLRGLSWRPVVHTGMASPDSRGNQALKLVS